METLSAVVDGQKRSSWRLRFGWANLYSKRTIICADGDDGKVDIIIGVGGCLMPYVIFEGRDWM